jgi:hypothetical protein
LALAGSDLFGAWIALVSGLLKFASQWSFPVILNATKNLLLPMNQSGGKTDSSSLRSSE